MRSFITTLCVATGLANALVRRQQAAVGFVDTYDALETGSKVGALHGLEYRGAVVRVHQLANGSQPIVPHSKPKFAQGSFNRDHYKYNGIIGDGYIDVFSAQNVSSFDLYGLWFACAAVDGTNFGPARPCTLSVYGYSSDGRQYISTADYDPPSGDEAQMMSVRFNYPNFLQINNLSIGLVSGSAPYGKTAIVIDSLDHLNFA